MTRRHFLRSLAGLWLLPAPLMAERTGYSLDLVAGAAGGPSSRQAGDRATRYLLLDSRLVERVENARLVLGKVQKEPRNPLFVEDKPWEVRFDNLYANVIFDEDKRTYRCWYNPFIVDEVTSNTPADARQRVPYGYKPKRREMGVCYATSKDGLVWSKPELGIIEFGGSRKNNLVMRNIHGVGVWKDLREAEAKHRCKAFMIGGVATSPDGLHWSEVLLCPEIQAQGDTHNNAFWDARLGKYVGITRLWQGGQRIVGRTESADYRNWTKAVEVLRGSPEEPHRQTYALLVFPYVSVYLGLLMVFDTREDVVDCELAWSPDTLRWEPVCPGTPLIPRGPQGSWDCGCIYGAAYPILRQGELRLYYGGSDGPHTGFRAGGLGLARLRPDGFAGFEPTKPTERGVLLTKPLVCDGQQLRVSTDAAEDELRVGVLSVDGPSPRGLCVNECVPVKADVTDAPVSWRSRRNLAALQGKSIRLQFEVRAARLYAFGFNTGSDRQKS